MDPRDYAPNAPGSLQYSRDGYWTYLPQALPPLLRWTERLAGALSAADWALARLGERFRRAPEALFGLLVHREAAASCRLAGLAVDLPGLLQFEARRRGAEESPAPEQAAFNLSQAIREACSSAARRPPSVHDLLVDHRRAWAGPVDARWPPGEFRFDQTWIGPPGSGPREAVFVPPPPEAMWAALESLDVFLQAPAAAPKLVRLAMAAYQFGVIHPFYDLNGRMARLLVARLLCAWGLLPGPCLALSPYFERHEPEYRSLPAAVSRENAWEDWLVYFLEGLRVQAEDALQLMAGLRELVAEAGAILAGERTAERLEGTLWEVFCRPYFTVNQLEAALPQGNFKSAARQVETLVRLGLLEEVTGQARHRVFCAPRGLEAITSL